MKFLFEQVCYHFADINNVDEPKYISPAHQADIDALVDGGFIEEKIIKKDGFRKKGYVITKKGLKTVIFADIFKRTKQYYEKHNWKLNYADVVKKAEEIAAF